MNSPVNFPEGSELFAPKPKRLVGKKLARREKVLAILSNAADMRTELNELQADCEHDSRFQGHDSTRGLHQCLVCGLLSHRRRGG